MRRRTTWSFRHARRDIQVGARHPARTGRRGRPRAVRQQGRPGRGPRPAGDGWECVEQTATEPGQEATLIKCRRTDRARFFFLLAKDYVVPPDQVRSPEQLATDVFPATYQKLFQKFEVTESKATTRAGKPGHELRISATHASMGEIRKRELVQTAGNHVFVVSAEGLPDVFDAESSAIEAWFAGAQFKNLP
ncbi:hypothetical protein [Nannocystis exedens]|uniref:hypothetical protein n=1 Tax=Nannocystis exedens TaxID=54 RepID=UPI000BBA058E|nr:hypothetical protein [Nannocystis exedens]PCC74270.1 hypothetical protein NAEX_07359 [Nannocystis exedens]